MNTQQHTDGGDGQHPLDRIAAIYPGGRAAIAQRLGVSVSAIGNWKARGETPAEHVRALCDMSNGEITVQELRPDDWHRYWPELAPALATTAQAATKTVAGGVVNG